MRSRAVDVVSAETAELGEGPRWDAERGEFVWVDIPAGTVRRAVFEGGSLRTVAEYAVGRPVGAVAPVAGGGGWVLAAGTGFAYLDPDGRVADLADAEPGAGRRLRMNDGSCDPAGRFFAGTMAYDETPGAGALHRLDLDGALARVRDRATIPNGIAWSPDGSTMYWADSGPGEIWRFSYDVDTGEMRDGVVVVSGGDGPGVPDGLALDDDGLLWVAVWGAGVVRRYTTDGQVLDEIRLPVSQPSAPCFVGATLLITSARDGLDPQALRSEPYAGRVFAADVGIGGPPAAPYRGPTT